MKNKGHFLWYLLFLLPVAWGVASLGMVLDLQEKTILLFIFGAIASVGSVQMAAHDWHENELPELTNEIRELKQIVREIRDNLERN